MSAREEAAAFGIDLALLDSNLRRTPEERLAQLEAMTRLSDQMQAQTLTPDQRRRLERRAMLEEVRAYGFEEDLALYAALTA